MCTGPYVQNMKMSLFIICFIFWWALSAMDCLHTTYMICLNHITNYIFFILVTVGVFQAFYKTVHMPCVWYDILHASCTLSHPADDGLCRVIWNHDAKKHTQSKPKWTCTTNGLWKSDIGNFVGMSTRTITTFYQSLIFFNLWWLKLSTVSGR